MKVALKQQGQRRGKLNKRNPIGEWWFHRLACNNLKFEIRNNARQVPIVSKHKQNLPTLNPWTPWDWWEEGEKKDTRNKPKVWTKSFTKERHKGLGFRVLGFRVETHNKELCLTAFQGCIQEEICPQVTNKCWTLWPCIGPQGWKKGYHSLNLGPLGPMFQHLLISWHQCCSNLK